MKQNYAFFLVIAEEMNITRAASKLYISQQCLSTHLKKLENELGVQLLIRKPTQRLTPAGEAFAEYLRKAQRMENSIREELLEINNNVNGQLSIGIHASRARVLVPMLYENDSRIRKISNLNIVDGMTDDFDKMLRSGRIDAYLGMNPPVDTAVNVELLMREGISIGVSEHTLKTILPERAEYLLSHAKEGVEITDLMALPMIVNQSSSKLALSVDLGLERLGVNQRNMVRVNGNDMHIEMCMIGDCACYVPDMFVPYVKRINQLQPDESRKLRLIRLKDFIEPNRFCFVTNSNQFMFSALREFQSIIRDTFKNMFGGVS